MRKLAEDGGDGIETADGVRISLADAVVPVRHRGAGYLLEHLDRPRDERFNRLGLVGMAKADGSADRPYQGARPTADANACLTPADRVEACRGVIVDGRQCALADFPLHL